MPRPTPARIFYLLIGLVVGLVAAVAIQNFLIPALIADLPFGLGAPKPVAAPAGPSQFTGGTLERVLPINLSHDRGGVVLRVNTLELYQDGLTLTYGLVSPRNGAAPQSLEPETFQLSDDRGTAYTLSPLGTAGVTSAGFSAGMASFTPAPPPEVRALRLVVPNVLAVGLRMREGQSRVVAGPWEFQLPLQR